MNKVREQDSVPAVARLSIACSRRRRREYGDRRGCRLTGRWRRRMRIRATPPFNGFPFVREAVGRDHRVLEQLLRDRADERRRRALVRVAAGR